MHWGGKGLVANKPMIRTNPLGLSRIQLGKAHAVRQCLSFGGIEVDVEQRNGDSGKF